GFVRRILPRIGPTRSTTRPEAHELGAGASRRHKPTTWSGRGPRPVKFVSPGERDSANYPRRAALCRVRVATRTEYCAEAEGEAPQCRLCSADPPPDRPHAEHDPPGGPRVRRRRVQATQTHHLVGSRTSTRKIRVAWRTRFGKLPAAGGTLPSSCRYANRILGRSRRRGSTVSVLFGGSSPGSAPRGARPARRPTS